MATAQHDDPDGGDEAGGSDDASGSGDAGGTGDVGGSDDARGPADPDGLEALAYVGPRTAERMAAAGVTASDVREKQVSYRDLVSAGVNAGVAAKLRREHSLHWTLDEQCADLDRRSEQVRGLRDGEREWVAAARSGDDAGATSPRDDAGAASPRDGAGAVSPGDDEPEGRDEREGGEESEGADELPPWP